MDGRTWEHLAQHIAKLGVEGIAQFLLTTYSKMKKRQ